MPDGEVFSMRKGAERFFADDIVRVTPAPKLCGWVGGWLRCLSSRRGQSVLTDLEPAAGTLERRRDRLARMHRMWFHPSGYTLGYTKRGALGTPTELVCLELDGRVHRVLQLPDAISEVVAHWGDWLVGCRNGHLYAYSVDGNMVWDRMPARNEVQEYAHPFALPTAPYFWLASSFSRGIALSDQHRLLLLDQFGHQLWEAGLSHPHDAVVLGFSCSPRPQNVVNTLLSMVERVLGTLALANPRAADEGSATLDWPDQGLIVH